jgi:hypothetical protein
MLRVNLNEGQHQRWGKGGKESSQINENTASQKELTSVVLEDRDSAFEQTNTKKKNKNKSP